jgi:predicted kinase
MENFYNTSPFPFCPSAPDFEIPWDELYDNFDWIRKMKDTPQSEIHHAEGDVLTHTKLVCTALTEMNEWRSLNKSERFILFTAALLHDCAKPLCTQVEDGEIVSPGHAVKGELLSRQILYMAEGFNRTISFETREAIVKLVRYHGLPLFFLDKANPLKTILAANQTIPMEWLAILAKADVLGRECCDKEELLGRISLFSEYCIEENCFKGKRAFPSEYSRFIYFQKENGNTDYEAYDDTRFEVILLSGLPAAGKDTWIVENASGLPVISLDALRQELGIAPEKDQGIVIQKAKDKAREYLRKSEPFVWNATNVTKMMRSQLISLFSSYGARVKLIYLEAPYEEILRRNSDRSRNVPEKVIRRLIEKLEVLEDFEAHEVIKIF